MAKLLVLYSSLHGQTWKIAERVASRLRAAGHAVEVRDARRPPSRRELGGLDGIILGSWVRGGRHMRSVRRFVTRHRELLARVPSVFFSVSLLQVSTREASRRRAAGYLLRFLAETGWRPDATACFAGAMTYTRFGWIGRRVMRAIWRREGIAGDLTRDHEYTRWEDVDRFADAIPRLLLARGGAPAVAAR